jgi:hypothetical protein
MRFPGPAICSTASTLKATYVLDARRVVELGVRDAEAAAEVEHGEVAEVGHRLERGAKAADVVDLRADVQVQALELEAVRRVQALDRGRRRLQPEAELRVRARPSRSTGACRG